ncbi:hypothetical protein [Paenibacillus contaminans]|uniref:3-keto-disaccharide hydrolase domain-containing protein n=1 Tax=Paenibacillus contaminans TaxID=450362 RepID=A0A329LWM7_9BACL|nr:hypothetical protein [Paenibacillus contaminans]RAV10903.1 hypothetical protein DQG23_36930 [Paenibacillus contaminans]
MKINSFTPTYGTSVLRVDDGAHLLQPGIEKDGIYGLDNKNSWVRKQITVHDDKWHDIQVYVVNGKAEVFIDGNSLFTYEPAAKTDADRIVLYSRGLARRKIRIKSDCRDIYRRYLLSSIKITAVNHV